MAMKTETAWVIQRDDGKFLSKHFLQKGHF